MVSSHLSVVCPPGEQYQNPSEFLHLSIEGVIGVCLSSVPK